MHNAHHSIRTIFTYRRWACRCRGSNINQRPLSQKENGRKVSDGRASAGCLRMNRPSGHLFVAGHFASLLRRLATRTGRRTERIRNRNKKKPDALRVAKISTFGDLLWLAPYGCRGLHSPTVRNVVATPCTCWVRPQPSPQPQLAPSPAPEIFATELPARRERERERKRKLGPARKLNRGHGETVLYRNRKRPRSNGRTGRQSWPRESSLPILGTNR